MSDCVLSAYRKWFLTQTVIFRITFCFILNYSLFHFSSQVFSATFPRLLTRRPGCPRTPGLPWLPFWPCMRKQKKNALMKTWRLLGKFHRLEELCNHVYTLHIQTHIKAQRQLVHGVISDTSSHTLTPNAQNNAQIHPNYQEKQESSLFFRASWDSRDLQSFRQIQSNLLLQEDPEHKGNNFYLSKQVLCPANTSTDRNFWSAVMSTMGNPIAESWKI